MRKYSGCSLDVVTDSRTIGTSGTGMHPRARFRTVLRKSWIFRGQGIKSVGG